MGEAHMPETEETVEAFLDFLRAVEGLSRHTLAAYGRDLAKVGARLAEAGCELPSASLEALRTVLFAAEHIEKPATRARWLAACRRYYQFLQNQGWRTDNPAQGLKPPSSAHRLPRVLSEAAVEALLNAPDTATALGLRDRAMLEVLYASGLRVSELVGLTLSQVRLAEGLVTTIGKGSKERWVPLGEVAQMWLEQYLQQGRPQLLAGRLSEAVFVTQRHGPMTRQMAWYMITRYARQLGLPPVSPHGLRHAFATHLVNHGADLRVVQMLLGHAAITTTQIYTHVARERLQQLHARHHPRG